MNSTAANPWLRGRSRARSKKTGSIPNPQHLGRESRPAAVSAGPAERPDARNAASMEDLALATDASPRVETVVPVTVSAEADAEPKGVPDPEAAGTDGGECRIRRY